MNQSAAIARLRDVLRRQHKALSTESSYPTNLIVRLLYGCGRRVTEPLNLRIKDVNLEDSRLSIRGAKAGKDRVVALPASLAPELVRQRDAMLALAGPREPPPSARGAS